MRTESEVVQSLKKYTERSVPRYTSYPTAPHFSKTIGPDAYCSWLNGLPAGDPISLYLHVPFCRQLCWYCGCNMKLATREAPIAQYAKTLRREIALVAKALPERKAISHLHWGGGTPTALTPHDFETTMTSVFDAFDIDDGAELALESDPRTLTPEMIDLAGRLGFTRASFGVQEFDPMVQAAINRIQPPEMVKDCVVGFRDAGVKSINFDLIYGLPLQTTDTLLKTIDLCVEMRPDRIALFGYAHVPWVAKKQRLIDEAALPGSDARLEQAQASSQALIDAGYVAIGLDHFALRDDPMARLLSAGKLRRNFQGYTTDQAETMLGVGATSIGRTPYGYAQNIAETGAWARAVDSGQLPVGKGYGFKGQDQLRSFVIEKLMCQSVVDLKAAGRRFGYAPSWYDEHLVDIKSLARDGLVRLEDGVLTLTETGRLMVRVVASVFDEYLPTSTARHAVSV